MAVFAHRSTDKAGNKTGNNACGKTCVTNNASCKRSGIILTAKKSISAKSILAIMLSICAFFSAAMSNLALSNPVPSNAVPLQTAPEAKDSAVIRARSILSRLNSLGTQLPTNARKHTVRRV